MAYKTYSFEDVTCTFSHKGTGIGTTTGLAIGSISIAMANDKTVHDVAADGSIMASKIAGKNGTISITVQQNAALNDYLTRWYNYINLPSTSTSQWESMKVDIRSNYMNELITCTGVSPQKMADIGFGSQGQLRTWNLLATEIAFEKPKQ